MISGADAARLYETSEGPSFTSIAEDLRIGWAVLKDWVYADHRNRGAQPTADTGGPTDELLRLRKENQPLRYGSKQQIMVWDNPPSFTGQLRGADLPGRGTSPASRAIRSPVCRSLRKTPSLRSPARMLRSLSNR